jgi:hypothetical protein
MKKYNNKLRIEKDRIGFEQAYIKYPREKLIKVSHLDEEKSNGVRLDYNLINSIIKEKGPNYFNLHTHPSRGSFLHGLPSPEDFKSFGASSDLGLGKGEIIVQRDMNTGKVQGYTFVKYNRKTSDLDLYENRLKIRELDSMGERVFYNKETPENVLKKTEELCKEFGLQLRFVPETGYFFNRKTGSYEKGNSIRKKIFFISITLFFFLSLFFNSAKTSGFFLYNYDVNHVNFLSLIFGAVFLLILMLLFVFNLKRKLLLNKLEKKLK